MAAGQKTGGRVKGVPNKATAKLKALAQKHTAAALKTLASIMKGGDTDSARVAAAKELLDRGYGKPAQAIVGGDEDSHPIRVTRVELVDLS
jgi:hypothetical protein